MRGRDEAEIPSFRTALSRKRLEEMIEEAIVDCDNESEQATGFFTMTEDNLV